MHTQQTLRASASARSSPTRRSTNAGPAEEDEDDINAIVVSNQQLHAKTSPIAEPGTRTEAMESTEDEGAYPDPDSGVKADDFDPEPEGNTDADWVMNEYEVIVTSHEDDFLNIGGERKEFNEMEQEDTLAQTNDSKLLDTDMQSSEASNDIPLEENISMLDVRTQRSTSGTTTTITTATATTTARKEHYTPRDFD